MIKILFSLCVIFAALGAQAQQRQPSLSSNPLNKLPSLNITGSNNSAITSTGSNLTVQNTSATAESIYNPQVPPGWFTYDVSRFSGINPAGSNAANTNMLGFYYRNQAASTGLKGNAVGLYGVATCEVDNCASWALNPTMIDTASAGGPPGSGIGRKLIMFEGDFSVYNPKTNVEGMVLTMSSSIVQPSGSDGYTCASGSAALWKHCFVIDDGSTKIGAVFGATALRAPNIGSVPADFNVYDSANVGHYVQVSGIPLGTNSGLSILDSTLANGILLGTEHAGKSPVISSQGTDKNIDLTLSAKGAGTINLTTVLQLKTYAVSALPACGDDNANSLAAVSDALAPTYNGTLTGGGSVHIPVFCSGASWTAH